MKYIATCYGNYREYHDDMYGEEVEILEFPYQDLFGDFRIFNGIQLQDMDTYLCEIVDIFNRIKSEHMNTKWIKENRERVLKEIKSGVGKK